MEQASWRPLGSIQRSNQTVNDALPGYQGQQDIDGIFTRTNPTTGKTEYVIIETKASTSSNVGGLNSTNDRTQLSSTWIANSTPAQVQACTLSAADGVAKSRTKRWLTSYS